MEDAYQNTMQALKRNGDLLDAVNSVAAIFFTCCADDYEKAFQEGMEIVSGLAGFHRAKLWKHEPAPGGKDFTFVGLHEWLYVDDDAAAAGPLDDGCNAAATVKLEDGCNTVAASPLCDGCVVVAAGQSSETRRLAPARWEESFRRNDCVNGALAGLPSDEFDVDWKRQGAKSILAVPVYLRDVFWGYAEYLDCRSERAFAEDEVNFLRFVSLMAVYAYINAMNSLEAKAANRAKNSFLSMMNHEIRTPMNAIIGMAAIGKSAADAKKIDYAFNQIIDASNHLLGVINGIFDMSRAECVKSIPNPVNNIGESPDIGETSFLGRHLLLVDDIEINREIVLAMLEPTLIIIDCAENGYEAVRMFSNEPNRYDLILIDIQMPEMDGYEATRQIRKLDCARAKEIPIIAMTANVFDEDVARCLEAGMTGHLGKPLDTEEVIRTLREYLIEK